MQEYVVDHGKEKQTVRDLGVETSLVSNLASYPTLMMVSKASHGRNDILRDFMVKIERERQN